MVIYQKSNLMVALGKAKVLKNKRYVMLYMKINMNHMKKAKREAAINLLDKIKHDNYEYQSKPKSNMD